MTTCYNRFSPPLSFSSNQIAQSEKRRDKMSGFALLPPDALLVLLNEVCIVANTGQLLRLALASKDLLRLVTAADYLWQQAAVQLGWLRPDVSHPQQIDPPSRHYEQHLGQQQPGVAPVLCAASPWFSAYSLRMSSRWRLRTLIRKVTPFLNVQSRLALQPGASVQQLAAAEASLGLRLPWELWELHRYRSGQAPGVAVTFADNCRLLGLHELQVVVLQPPGGPSLAPAVPTSQEQQLAALQGQLPQQLCLSNKQQQQDAGPAAVVFLANAMGSPSYAISHDAAIHLCRGFTQRRVASSLSGFLQRLLT